MKQQLKLLVPVAVLALTVSACQTGIFGERGSGNIDTETRGVSGFDEIVLLGSGTVLVDVTGTESLTIEAEDNILPLLTTDVRGNTLELGSRRSISPTRDIVYTITAASLKSLEISGSGEIVARGVGSQGLSVAIRGSGDIQIPDADIDRFEADISGSGTVTVSGGTQDLDVSISGSGAFAGEDFMADNGFIRLSGSGSAVVNVSVDLEVQLSGSGSVEYIGDPSLDVDSSGSGEVRQR